MKEQNDKTLDAKITQAAHLLLQSHKNAALTGMVSLLPSISTANDFLGAPIIPSGEMILKTDTRMDLKTSLSHDEVVTFYRKALNDLPDIKFREWSDATYIEDDGKLKWHSITISKQDKEGTNIVIIKDTWTWILGTLLLRFIGVFVVLILLLLGISLSGAIISRSVKKMEAKKR